MFGLSNQGASCCRHACDLVFSSKIDPIIFSSIGTDLFSHTPNYFRKGLRGFFTIFYYVRILLILFCRSNNSAKDRKCTTRPGHLDTFMFISHLMIIICCHLWLKHLLSLPIQYHVNELTSWSCSTSVCRMVTCIM